MEYHVNKSKDDFRCFGTTKVVIEGLTELKNHFARNINNFSYTKNSKLRNVRSDCNISMNRLIFKTKEGINVCEGQFSMASSSLCKRLNKLSNHLIIKTISDSCQSFLANANDFKTSSEMFDSITCLRSTADGNNGIKAETVPSTNTVLCENFSVGENKNKVKQFMVVGNNKKLLHKIYMTTFFPVFKASSHKNVFYELKPNLDILLKPTTMCNYKKNNYFKELRKRICFPRDQVDSAYKLYTFVPPLETRKRAKREKVTNTSITCFVKIPPKSYIKTKKITFMPKKKKCEKSHSSCCAPRITTLYTNCKKDTKKTPCEKRLFIEKLNKFIALNTLLEEKTPEEKHEIIKCLAQNGVALPTATTLYERKIMNKVQKELAVSNKLDKLQSGNRVKSLKINFLRPSRDKAQTNSSSTKKHLISEKNCAHSELCISNHNLNDEKITEIFPPPAKRHKEIKEHIGLVGKPKLKNVQTDKCDLHRTWPTCSKKEKRAWNLGKNCRDTEKSFLVGLTVQNDQGRKSSFLKRIKHCKLFNKKNCLLKIELYPYYFSKENHNDGGLFTHNNNTVKVTIEKPTVQSECELKHLKNLVDESRISKLNKLWKINNQILFIYEKSRQIHYQLYDNILENNKSSIRHKDNINIFNPSLVDEQNSSKNLIRKHSILSLWNVRTIDSSLSPNIRTTNSKINGNLLRKCSPFYIPPKNVIDFNCINIVERKFFEDVFPLRCKNHVCSSPMERSHKFVTSRSLSCMETEFNEKFHYKNFNKTKEKYLSTNIFVVDVDVIKSKNLDVLCCNDYTTLNHSQMPKPFYGHSNKVQDLKRLKVNNNKHSTYKATSLQECTNVKKNMDTNFQVKNINSKMTSVVPSNASSENCFYLLGKITGAQKTVCSQYATEKHIRFKCPEEITFHKNKRRSQSSLPHSRRKHTCCIKDNDGSSDFFRYPELKSSTSIKNKQKKKNMSLKSKRIQTQLSLLQMKSSFFLKDAQNQAKLLEPQSGSLQYRPKKYMLKKRSRGGCDKGKKSSSDICKSLRRNLYPPDSKLKRNTSSLSTHNSKFMIKEAPSPKRILIKGRNRSKWRGISCESLGDVKKCWCKIFEKYKWRLKEIYSPTYSRPLAYTENLNGATCDLLEDKNDSQLENKEYKLTFSDFKGLTEEQLKSIIKQLKQAVSNSNEIPSNSSFEDNMTSEEEMMFYCDYAAALNNDMLSKLNSDGSIFSMDDDEKDSAPQGIKLLIRPNSRTLNRKWWSFFIKDL